MATLLPTETAVPPPLLADAIFRLQLSRSPWIECEISSYRFPGIPSAPHEIQKLFLLKFRLIGGAEQTVELDEPIAFDVLFHFFTRQFTAGPFQDLRR
jgi:hypothetical protein